MSVNNILTTLNRIGVALRGSEFVPAAKLK